MATIIPGKNPNKPYTVRYTDQNGKQREQSFAKKMGPGGATEFKVKVEHDILAGVFVDPKRANERFRTVAERWLARHPGSPNTIKNYETVLRLHILPIFGNMGLAQVANDRESMETFVRYVLPGKGLGASVIRTCYVVISAIVNDAIKSGRLSQSRLRGIELPAGTAKAELVFATSEQIKGLANEMPEPYGFTIYLMRGCGLRLGEVLAVQPEDFHEGGSLRLARQLAQDGKKTAQLKHRSAEDFRDIPIPDYVLRERPCDFDGFPPVSHRTYRQWFNKARDAVGLPATFTPHVLRHTFASTLLANGVPITSVAHFLGHNSIQITFGIYGHLVPNSFDQARKALDREWTADE